MSYILALDQGTTSSRAVLVDAAGRIRASAQRELTQIYPRPGWVEHDPEEIWASQRDVAAEATALSGALAGDIAAVGITNQRETTIVWDRDTGEPVYNAIVWQDRRTAPICERLIADGLEPLVRERTGLVIDPYFSGTKLRWLLENVHGLRDRAERGALAFGTVDSWLVWKLTGGRRHITDASNASRTLLYNIHTGAWDADLLDALAIPESLLPEVVGSSEVVGEVVADHGFSAGAPIAGIAGDQQAALFGQGCFEPGMAKNTYGTGCFVLMNTGGAARESANRLLTTVAWRLRSGDPIQYALEGSVFVGGAVVQWLRDGLGLIRTAADVEALAATVPDNGGVYLVPAFTGLGAPHWDPYARGTIVGITRGTTAGHLARAALESIAYQSYDVLHAMEQDAGTALTELRVDGGASQNDLLMQFQADLLQRPVVRPDVVETTVLGAARLAGNAIGVLAGAPFSFASAAGGNVPLHLVAASPRSLEQRFEPRRSAEEMAALHATWRRAVQRSAGWESVEA